jgi:F-type H+-transporting ATPase subunit b
LAPQSGWSIGPEVLVLPDLSVVWVILFVLLLTVILNQLLFKPLLAVMAQREHAVRSARELAEKSAADARAASEEFDRKTSAARAEIYQQMDEMRKLAMNERAEILTATRAEAEAEVARASARLQAEAVEARRRLAADAEALGAEAADRILGRKAS